MERFDSNYFVEAGAGAGKTYTLVEIITDLLVVQGKKPSEIVAITFTNKSTQEMYSRITLKLEELLKEAAKSQDEEKYQKIQGILFKVPEIQISTIHSFCEKMLRTMPFESELGVEVEQIDNPGKELRELLGKNQIQKRFDHRIEQLGVLIYTLGPTLETLLKYQKCEVMHHDFDSNEMVEVRKLFKEKVNCIHKHLHMLYKAVEPNKQEVIASDFKTLLTKSVLSEDECFEFYEFLAGPYKGFIEKKHQAEYAIIDYGKNAFKIFIGEVQAQSPKLAELLMNLYYLNYKNRDYNCTKIKKEEVEKSIDYSIISAFSAIDKGQPIVSKIVHSLAIPTMEELVKEYVKDYRLRGLATKDDILKFARNMLRNSETARQYFHTKYKKIFVDEFQDTDDVQVELLFYLAAKHFDEDWKECILEDETLFVVGDPKQAIYRFRGADFSLFNEVREKFEKDSNCTIEVKNDNYRSSEEICKFVDETFGNPAHSLYFSGENNQTSYTSMTSINGSVPGSGVYQYDLIEVKANKKDNIEGVTYEDEELKKIPAFIQQAVEDKVAEYKDFLIITNRRKRAQQFGEALRDQGIPCNLSGEIKFIDIKAIANIVKIFQLCDRKNSNMLLLEVLVQVYGVNYEALRTFLILIGKQNVENHRKIKITELMYNLDVIRDYKLNDKELEAYQSMVELKIILDKARELSEHPIALFEYIINGGGHIYTDEETEYNQLIVFLSKMKEYTDLDSSAFTDKMIEMADTDLENQIILDDNRVRVMNLHKSKGLEGKIVILTYTQDKCKGEDDEESKEKRLVKFTSHYDKVNGTIDLCISAKIFESSGVSIVGESINWESSRLKEYDNDLPEQNRLKYVAVTRAESIVLLPNIVKPELKYKDKDKSKLTVESEKALKNPKVDLFEDVSKGTPKVDENHVTYGNAFKQLIKPSIKTKIRERESNDRYTYILDREQKVTDKLQEQPTQISPSELNKSPKKVKDDSESGVELKANKGDKKKYEKKYEAPYGADYGTIVHRVMELVALEITDILTRRLNKQENPFGLHEKIEKAFNESRDELKSTRQLFGKDIKDIYSRDIKDKDIQDLVNKIKVRLDFLNNQDNELVEKLMTNVLYPELRFFIQADKATEFGKYLTAFEKLKDKDSFSVEGIIDLVVKENGNLDIIDYKTDSKLLDESDDVYEQRLVEEYTPQLNAYKALLSENQSVGKLYISAIPLNGKLIEIV